VTADYYNSLTNRLTFNNFGYDNAGNQTTISPYAVSYDVENRQTGFTSTSNGSATYTYDGDGRRVTKTTGGVTTTYVYDAGGNLAAEYSSQPPSMPCQTCYLTTDHLGSTRVITDQNGNAVSRHDFLPFGEELATSNRTAALDYGVTDNVMHRYTGQQRDLEGPGLDFFHARYFQGEQGRFTSPDPDVPNPYDPQSWDGYAYSRNAPLTYVDPTGRNYTVCNRDGKDCADLTDKQYQDYLSANKNVYQTAGGSLYVINDDGSDTKIGSAGYYNEKDVAAAQQLVRNVGPFAEGLLTLDLLFIQGPGFAALGASSEIMGLGLAERGAPSAARSGYTDATKPNSLPNRATNVTRAEFEENLSSAGWTKAVSKDGQVTIYTKDGARYVVRDDAKSTGGPTADFYQPGSKGIDLKIRLQR
jgi:RHS repeat-associated protein